MGRIAEFRSDTDRRSYVSAYDEALAMCPVPFDEFDVESRFGRTHVIRAGRVDAPPIVFLHGKTMSATMWVDQVPLFVDTHCVYLIDTIGDMNKSAATAMLRSKAAVVEWLDATFDSLNIDQAAIVGLSYGAWMATTYAMARPKRVERLVIMSPAGVFSAARPAWIARAIYVHMIRPSQNAARKFVNTSMMPDTIARLPKASYGKNVEQYVVGVPGFRMARDAPPTVYKADALSALTMPTLVLIGADETVCDGPKAAVKARERIPHARVEVVPGSNHAMNFDQPELVATLLKDFLVESS